MPAGGQPKDKKEKKELFGSPLKTAKKRKADRRTKQLNAKMHSLSVPKSPLVVFNELFENIPIHVHDIMRGTRSVTVALVEVDFQVFRGEHANKEKAKIMACENYLRHLLSEKLTNERVVSVNSTGVNADGAPISTSKSYLEGIFPWSQYASLALYYLIQNWNIKVDGINTREEEDKEIVPGEGFIPLYVRHCPFPSQIPYDPTKYNPVDLLYKLVPSISFEEKVIKLFNVFSYECVCKLKGKTFTASGFSTKKKAKKDCAIKTINGIWGYDFNAPNN